jgi:hypothetical protein
MSQQCLRTTSPLFEPEVASLCERAVTGQHIAKLRFRNIKKFFTRHVGFIERDPLSIHIQPQLLNLRVLSFLAFHNAVGVRNPILVSYEGKRFLKRSAGESLVPFLSSHVLPTIVFY